VTANQTFLAQMPIFSARSQRRCSLIYISEQQKSFGSIRADLRKRFSNRNAPTRASPASAEPRSQNQTPYLLTLTISKNKGGNALAKVSAKFQHQLSGQCKSVHISVIAS